MICDFFNKFVFGISFALAMGISNMTKLSATISFLDLRYWNPALAFVMCGAILVSFFSFAWIFKMDKPLLDSVFHRPIVHQIDSKLILGSVIFGVGWGLAGACPGPALVNVGSGNIPPLIYNSCLIGGIWLEAAVSDYVNTGTLKLDLWLGLSHKVSGVKVLEGAEHQEERLGASTNVLVPVSYEEPEDEMA
jgi:uncharacterized membrane protein YedE/YeeE